MFLIRYETIGYIFACLTGYFSKFVEIEFLREGGNIFQSGLGIGNLQRGVHHYYR